MEKGIVQMAAFAAGARTRAQACARPEHIRAAGVSGQAAVELLAYAAFFLLIFVSSVAVFSQQQSQGLTRAESAYAQQIALSFADSIQTAFVAGPGFSQQVSIPHDLLGKPYKLVLSKGLSPASTETGFVYVEWNGIRGNTSFSAPAITSAYSVTESGSFIVLDTPTNQIIIDPNQGQQLCMRNTNEGGADKIGIGPLPC